MKKNSEINIELNQRETQIGIMQTMVHILLQFAPKAGNIILASITRGFKIGVTKNARQINADFSWQARFHDRIIRTDKEFDNIRTYIINNPKNWEKGTSDVRQ